MELDGLELVADSRLELSGKFREAGVAIDGLGEVTASRLARVDARRLA